MELYTIPFEGAYIIYRPLRKLAFLGNEAMVEYIRLRQQHPDTPARESVESFLRQVQFWDDDAEPPLPWIPGDCHRPTMAVLHMTSACNLRCTYCYARGGEMPGLCMSVPMGRAVIDAAVRHALDRQETGFSLSFHGGGEPSLHWDVLQALVEYAREQPLPCEISMATNAVLTREQCEYIANHFSGLSISFDGIRAVQDTQRPRADGSGSYDAVMASLRYFDDAGLSYGIRMTVMPASVADLPASVALICQETHCQEMQVEPCFTTERGKYADPSPEQAHAFIAAYLDGYRLAREHGRMLSYSGARPWVLTASFCQAPAEAIVTTPEGDIVACFETHDRRHPLLPQFVLGAVDDAGVHFELARVREFAAGQAKRRDRCAGCFCFWHCAGDCASRCLATADPQRVRCLINRTITRELLAEYLAAGDGIWYGMAPDQQEAGGCTAC